MAKKKAAAPVDPVEVALQQIVAICDRLTREQRKQLANRVDETPGALDDLKHNFWCHAVVERGHTIKAVHDAEEADRKLKGRNKPVPANISRNKSLWEEKRPQTWEQFYLAHPDEEPAKLRSAVRTHRKSIDKSLWKEMESMTFEELCEAHPDQKPEELRKAISRHEKVIEKEISKKARIKVEPPSNKKARINNRVK